MLGIGYDKNNVTKIVNIKNNEIELVEGLAGAGKTKRLLDFVESFQNNAMLITKDCLKSEDIMHGKVVCLTEDNYINSIKEAIDFLKKDVVILVIEDDKANWAKIAIQIVMKKLRKYFRNERVLGCLAVDAMDIALIDEDILTDISNIGCIVKLSMQKAPEYFDLSRKYPSKIVRSIMPS